MNKIKNTFRHLTRTGNQRTAGEQNHIKRDHPVKQNAGRDSV